MERELRAFPRFECSLSARLVIGEVTEDGQIIDLSQSGCKLLPATLQQMRGRDWRPGTPLSIEIAQQKFAAVLVWATPNLSALGCRFEPDIPADTVARLLSQS